MNLRWLQVIYLVFRAFKQYNDRKEEEDKAAREFELKIKLLAKILSCVFMILSFLSIIFIIIRNRRKKLLPESKQCKQLQELQNEEEDKTTCEIIP